MSKIILNLAVSLDGYIARLDGSYDFLNGDNEMNEEATKDFESFVSDIDVLIMGSSSYDQFEEQGGHPFPNMFTYVLTSQEYADENNVMFTDMEIEDLEKEAKSKSEKNIWLFGGAKVVKQFLDLDFIDEFIITKVPKIIGTGIPLFLFTDKNLDLELVSTKTFGDNVTLHYKKK
jgi:dihydrofolate reductase